MESNPVSMVQRQFEALPAAGKQVLLLLAVLKELLYLLLAIARGTLPLEDAFERVKALRPDYFATQDEIWYDSPMSQSEIQDNDETTCNESERPSSLVNAVNILCRTIVQRDLKSVSRMLDAAPRLVDKRHEGGWYPLHAAVLSGDAEIIKRILACPKADVNVKCKSSSSASAAVRESELGTHIQDFGGATPLHFACMLGNTETIRLLVEHGALFKGEDSMNREPIEYFNIQRDLDALTVFHELYMQQKRRRDFVKVVSSTDDLAKLVWKNKYEIFERSVKKNPNVTSKFTHHDFSLLHLAVILQRRRFVEFLIAHDRDLVNKVDKRSEWDSAYSYRSFGPAHIPHRYVKDATPLHYACLMQDMDIAEMLLEAGADWNIKDWKGRIPEQLIYAVDETCDELKSTFMRLCDAEAEKRKNAESEKDEQMGVESPESSDPPLQGESYDEDDRDDYVSEDGYMDTDANAAQQNDSDALQRVSVESLLQLETALADKLVGQQGPIRLIANAIRLRESGWVDPDRPLTMLFLGSSGVGKTELAKQLALYLHGKDGLATDKGDSISALEKKCGFVRIDMSEYQEPHTALNLIGAPKSYVGYGDGGALTQPLKKNPKAVVLLDEIEKAHPDVLNTFLQVFDDGRITDSKDGVISCKNAIFIMTSNLGADRIKEESPMLRQLVAQSEEQGRPESYVHLIQDFIRSIRPILKYHLRRDEFVGRINQIVVFLPLSQEEVELTVQRELAMWCKRTEEKHSISLTWTDEVVRKLALSYDVNYGVRSVANEVQRIAMQLVADAYIRGKISKNWKASLATNEVGDIVMEASENEEKKAKEEKMEDKNSG